jgi:hypothetical protein
MPWERMTIHSDDQVIGFPDFHPNFPLLPLLSPVQFLE